MSNTVPIDARGYGKIYKLVMRDKELALLAKAIYAYFCAYAVSGTTAFPKREKITRDLGINKDTYTKHLGKLVEDGYIRKERSATGNIYTIMQTVSRYTAPAAIDEPATDMLIMESIQAHMVQCRSWLSLIAACPRRPKQSMPISLHLPESARLPSPGAPR